jgi:sulfur transfer complex TusBCD TusB component (DsrH family)
MIRFFAKRFRSWIDYTVVVEANVMALDDELMARGSESWILQIPRTSKQRVTRAKVGGPKTFEREWI